MGLAELLQALLVQVERLERLEAVVRQDLREVREELGLLARRVQMEPPEIQEPPERQVPPEP